MLMKHKWNLFFSSFFFLLFNVFVMRSRLSHLRLYQHIQRRDETMSFSCSRCSRDLFKICKILFDVDTCDKCIKLKKSCDVFIFEITCESRLSLFIWFLTFLKKASWKWKDQVSCRNWEYLCKVLCRKSRNSIVVFSSKENSWWFVRSRVQSSSFVEQTTSSCSMFQNFWKEEKQFCRVKATSVFSSWRDRWFCCLSFYRSVWVNRSRDFHWVNIDDEFRENERISSRIRLFHAREAL